MSWICRFLRLFLPFRQLEIDLSSARTQLAHANTDATEAQVESQFWKERCLEAESEVKRLNAQLREDAQKAADYVAMTHTHRRIFSRVDPAPPADFTPQVAQPGRVFARDLERRGVVELKSTLKQMLDEANEAS